MKNAARQDQALILGNDTFSFLAVVRSLGRKGVSVHVAGVDANSPALWSRYVRKVHPLPNFDEDRDRWCEAVRGVLEANRFDIIIPCNDPNVLRFVYYTSKHGTVHGLELPSAPILEVTSSKQRSHELAFSLGIPVVRSHLISSRDELAGVLGALRPPVVLKPLSSFSVQDTLNRQEVRKAFSSAEALSVGSALLEQGAIQVQENFAGCGTGVEFLASNGRILCAFQHIRLHEPPHGGGSSYRKGIPVDERLLKSTEALVAALQYDGVGMVEYKWNLETNDYVFIEINARFWGSLALAVASGADFPWFLYRYRVHGETTFPSSFKTGLCCRHWTLDVEWFKTNARYSRKDPLLATKPWPAVLAELGNCFLGRERIDTLTLDDPQPFLREIAQSLGALCATVGRRARRRLHGTGLYRRVRRRRLARLLEQASTVEFVCYGNICRSPFAAEFLKHQLLSHGGPLRVGSSGFHMTESRHSPEAAVTGAKEFGIDLSVHRSRRITSAIVDKADVVFVFDWQNLESFSKEFPQARDKLFLTGEMDPRRGALTIQDPYGHGAEVFRATFSRISQLIGQQLLRCVTPVRR
jgi:protein-tyrosine-phosphatase/predicted ATP-grasp superfamily ATP-dependent carboligase